MNWSRSIQLLTMMSFIFLSSRAMTHELEDVDLTPATIDAKLQDMIAADLAQTKYSIPITINERVMKTLEYLLTRERKYFVAGLQRSGRYRPMIETVFREESIPLDLIYLAQVESLFTPHALSKANAKGIWQFVKGTAVRYGLRVNNYIDERSDPEKSTRAAARYLRDLYAIFNDWNLVLAAYNWGEGNVIRLIKRSGLKDFWQLADLRRKLPEETKNHVPLIQASVILARNPEKFGLLMHLDAPIQYSEVTVSRPIDLRAAAKLLNISFDQLKELNPELRGLTTPADYPNYRLKVPVGAKLDIQRKIAALPVSRIRPTAEHYSRYGTQPGYRFSQIARKKIEAPVIRTGNISAHIHDNQIARKRIEVPVIRTGNISTHIHDNQIARKRIEVPVIRTGNISTYIQTSHAASP